MVLAVARLLLALLPFVAAGALVTVVRPKDRYPKNVLVLVDCSGSVSSAVRPHLMAAVRHVATMPTDEMELAAIAWSGSHSRWKYKGADWAKLPDGRAVRSLEAWLGTRFDSGTTRIVPPLRSALADGRRELGVVVVTDGGFDEATRTILRELRELQAARKARGLPPALVGVVGVGVSRQDGLDPRDTWHVLARLGRDGGGGYYLLEPDPE